MRRRELMGALGAGAASVALTGRAARADHHGNDEHLATMARCAELCAESASHCLNQLREGAGDADRHAENLQLALGCKEFCALSASLMACGNPLAPLAHEANAEACERCAEACERSDAAIMKACAEQCRKCAAACRRAASA